MTVAWIVYLVVGFGFGLYGMYLKRKINKVGR